MSKLNETKMALGLMTAMFASDMPIWSERIKLPKKPKTTVLPKGIECYWFRSLVDLVAVNKNPNFFNPNESLYCIKAINLENAKRKLHTIINRYKLI
jgi:hypothetical protein